MLNQRANSVTSFDDRLDHVDNLLHQKDTVIYQLKQAFRWFSVIASLNHALNYVVTSYATSLLGKHLSVLYFFFFFKIIFYHIGVIIVRQRFRRNHSWTDMDLEFRFWFNLCHSRSARVRLQIRHDS